MSVEAVYKYRLRCTTEGVDVYVWDTEAPTACPNDAGHTIDSNSVVIVDKVSSDFVTDHSNKQIVHQTSKPESTTTYFTGEGDDIADINNVGGGTEFQIEHKSGVDSTTQSVIIDLNIANNETWLHEGYATWSGCLFDFITMEIIPIVTAQQAGANTDYSIYGGYLIVPAETAGIGEGAGLGTCDVTATLTDPRGGLVYISSGTGFWNADYNAATKQFENITAAPAGDGFYNMFSVAVTLERFVNKVQFVGEDAIMLQSSDSVMMGQGMRLKATAITAGDDHDWKIACNLTLHRSRTT